MDTVDEGNNPCTNKKLNFLHKGYGETEDLALTDLVKRLIDDGGVLFCLD